MMKVVWKDIVVGENISLAKSFYSRLKGLMFQKEMNGDGLLIDPCRSIHTFFMCFSIDVAFLDKKGTIVKIIRNLPPWRMTSFYISADQVLELKSGQIPSNVKEGDRFILCSN